MSIFDIFRPRPKEPARLPFHTDIHCHLVPGVDDGSQDVTTSVELLQRMHGWGIDRVFISPHVTQDRFENTPQTLAAPFAELKEAVAQAGLPVELHHHAEYRIDEFFLEQIAQNNLRTLPHDMILVENAYAQEPWHLDKLLFDLRLKGLTPILAHPERYIYYSKYNRARYSQLHSTGLYFQINLLSLAGYYGKEEKQTAEWLMQQGMVEFIGTDIHKHEHADSIDAYLSSRDFQRHSKMLAEMKNDTI